MPHEAMDLAFDVAGKGPPLLVLHDLFASSAHWRAVSAGLARHHRVYSVDLRNHGASPRAAHMSYLSMADDVLRLIERQGLERPILVGHGMGGKVAMALALTTPRAVGGLGVIDVTLAGDVDPWAGQLCRMTAMVAALPVGPNAAAVGSARSPTSAEAALQQWAMGRVEAAPAHIDWRSKLPAIALSLHELCGFPRHLRHLASALPLLAIVGSRSLAAQATDASTFQPMFAQTRVEVIAGAGHWVHADQPQALLGLLRTALVPASPAAAAAPPAPAARAAA